MRAKFTECVTMLTENKCISSEVLTYEKFLKSYETRATITPIGYTSDETKIYSIIIPMPPAVLSNVSFIGVMWNGVEYVFTAPLKVHQNTMHHSIQFLCGTIKPAI